MIVRHLKRFGPVVAASVLVACGGSGGGTAGIDRTGAPAIAAFGTVTAFGSVVVNGVRYETSAAQFVINGSPGSQDDLSVGDVVLVTGTLNAGGVTGVATSVRFDNQVQGPISTIDSAAGTVVVLGQTVRITADTSFDDSIQPRGLAGLTDGDLIEVSGLIESDGSIRATRIEPKPFGELELTGTVANHDAAARTFNVNSQVVAYAAVSLLRNFPGGVIANGQLVEIKGGAVASGVWSPTSIEYQANALGGAAGDRREVEGFISRFVSATDFTVANLAVTTNAQTAFEGGVAADLGLNVKVEVEGALNSVGVLVATKVDIRRSAAVRLAALVDSVDAANRRFVVLGVLVKTDGLTRIEDKSSLDVRPFGVANLNVGNYVEVRGVEFPAGSGEIMAVLVERDDPEPDSELQGFVQAVANPNLTILGVAVGTDGGTQFRDVDDSPLEAAEFFGTVAVGDLVQATGVETSAQALAADEVELEN